MYVCCKDVRRQHISKTSLNPLQDTCKILLSDSDICLALHAVLGGLVLHLTKNAYAVPTTGKLKWTTGLKALEHEKRLGRTQ